MTTMNREEQKQVLIDTANHVINRDNTSPYSENLKELARIALASLEAEPVAYIFKHPAGKLFWALTDESNKEQSDVIPVYAAPPVPVVPEEKPMPNPLSMYAVDAVAAIAEVRGWNACRAAMLQSQDNCIKDGWISCSERMPAQDDWILIYSKHGEYMAGQVQEEYVELSDGTLSWLGNALFWMPLPEPPRLKEL
ncbi:TPA: DUF551 domain-containing protein [Escherichia coli]|uniref:DUF551 domain-containing protein n=1 Tax=Escherichia fergusonii TaxID=564 RepID=UPI000F66568A|nr:DUF551 domain-containing protein [Escherichia fergusonii]HAV8374733.1 DUF551 domain-containing protein [Escherichia coli]QCZ31816.1 DUF551 domain-containing protein [Escherichia fergusonii]HAW3567376.1 DUF551 domain-containing protein [Escherichia coli]HAW7228496.1 DUF551 domain-containing protein [Escherichia coli]HAW8432466.1 DUF551 domain-containing protein [Escherichia coli]